MEANGEKVHKTSFRRALVGFWDRIYGVGKACAWTAMTNQASVRLGQGGMSTKKLSPTNGKTPHSHWSSVIHKDRWRQAPHSNQPLPQEPSNKKDTHETMQKAAESTTTTTPVESKKCRADEILNECSEIIENSSSSSKRRARLTIALLLL